MRSCPRIVKSGVEGMSPSHTFAPHDACASGSQMPRTWSGQDLPPPWDAPSPSYIPRPFLPSRDHLGRPMSRGILSRATSGLKPLQFDTSQRRREYTAILAAKKHVRLLREAAEMVAAELVSVASLDDGMMISYRCLDELHSLGVSHDVACED